MKTTSHDRKHSELDFYRSNGAQSKMLGETLTLPRQDDPITGIEATRKSKTPNRCKKTSSNNGLLNHKRAIDDQQNERTQAMAQKLK